jgi:hypothetical protein
MKAIAQGVIRVLTILFFLRVFSLLLNYGTYITSYYSHKYSGWNIYYELVLAIAITIISGVIIYFGWWKSEKIAKILVGDLSQEPLVINTSNGELIKLILSILGIFLFVQAIADIGGLVAYQIRASSDEYLSYTTGAESSANQIKNWVTTLITLVFSIILMGKGRRIGLLFVNFWKYGSLSEPSREDGNDRRISDTK